MVYDCDSTVVIPRIGWTALRALLCFAMRCAALLQPLRSPYFLPPLPYMSYRCFAFLSPVRALKSIIS